MWTSFRSWNDGEEDRIPKERREVKTWGAGLLGQGASPSLGSRTLAVGGLTVVRRQGASPSLGSRMLAVRGLTVVRRQGASPSLGSRMLAVRGLTVVRRQGAHCVRRQNHPSTHTPKQSIHPYIPSSDERPGNASARRPYDPLHKYTCHENFIIEDAPDPSGAKRPEPGASERGPDVATAYPDDPADPHGL